MQACSTPSTVPADYNQKKTFPIDPALKEFYNELDGKNFLGVGISPLLEMQGDRCQYTINALMCFDPQATGIARFYLMPLGVEMGVTEEIANNGTPENQGSLDDYIIYPEILPLYQQFYGRLYAGQPITNAFYNPTTRQIEQYFENLGFYYDPQSPGSKTGLIGYGQEICREKCPEDLLAVPPNSLPQEDPLKDMIHSIEVVGGESIFGEQLTDISIAPDGNLEVVYENAVFFAPANSPRRVQLRELPNVLGIPAMSPGPETYGAQNNVYFYPTEGELGYHIPLVFDRFLQLHGGMLLSGDPIGDPVKLSGSDQPRQCFHNLCLEYDKNAEQGLQVALVNLGKQYLQSGVELKPYTDLGGLGAALQGRSPSIQHLAFTISEQSPQVSRNEKQVIEIFVYDRKTYKPAANVTAWLTVFDPDGTPSCYEFSSTDKTGVSTIEVSPMPDARNGTLISYQVCLMDAQAACKTEGYLIWGY